MGRTNQEILSRRLNQPLSAEEIDVLKQTSILSMPGTFVDSEGGLRRIQRVFAIVDPDNPTEMVAVGVDEDARAREELGAVPDAAVGQFAGVDLEALVNIVPAQIALWEIDGDEERLTYANPAFQNFSAELTDGDPARALTLAGFIGGSDQPPLERVKAWARGAFVRNYERVITDKHGRVRHILVTLYPLVGSPPARLMSVAIDVTDQRLAEGAAAAGQREAEYGLTTREREVLALIADGDSNNAIAASLRFSRSSFRISVFMLLPPHPTR